MINRRTFTISLLAIPVSSLSLKLNVRELTHGPSEAFRSIYSILQLRDWWRDYDIKFMTDLARKAGFTTIVGNVLIDIDNKRSATILENKKVSYITEINGVVIYNNIEEAISGIYGINLT